jgi:hypothetical protein
MTYEEFLKWRGRYWFKKTKVHFHNCFGEYPLENPIPAGHGGCLANVENPGPAYDACRECHEAVLKYSKGKWDWGGEEDYLTLDDIVGL